MKLRVTRKGHNRYEGEGRDAKLVTYKVGDVFEGSERELAAFRDRLVNTEAPVPAPKKAKGGKPAGDGDGEGGEGGGQ